MQSGWACKVALNQACMSGDIHAHALEDQHVGAGMASMPHASCWHAHT